MKRPEAKKPELGIYISLFASSIAVWYYLLTYIMQLTMDHPAELKLLPLTISHSLSFLCIFYCFVLLLHESTIIAKLKSSPKRIKMANRCRNLLFLLWGPMLAFSLVSLAATRLLTSLSGSNAGQLFILIFGAVAVVWLFWKIFDFRIPVRDLNWGYALVPFFWIFHAAALSLITAGIEVKTEKEFYVKNEIVRFSAKPQGYVFLPQVLAVDYCGDTVRNQIEHTYALDLKKEEFARGISWLRISYKPQIIGIRLEEFFLIPKTDL